ncbi:MAG TPA: CCA tRNA nucleotidyltransferase, partial [Acetobacteraceae bacterium]|nr:CCA tRNA nucleotidyltransferase [Acetobacteraceae bacterium]
MTEAPALVLTPPPPFLSDPALRAVLAALPEARVVGGAVRDALAGHPVADVDLATPRAPEDVTAALLAAGLKAVPTGIDHGTVTAVSGHRGFEVTTLRRDVRTDGRHAEVAFTDDWRADAARRDFTINALSMTQAGAVFDHFAGIADLRAGHVRFVGHAATRIAEDYLRILRFFRFWARYGAGTPDAEAVAAIADAVPGLARLSAERVWMELKRILAAPDPCGAVALMQRLGVLEAVLPEGAAPARLAALVAAGAPPDPLQRLAALL